MNTHKAACTKLLHQLSDHFLDLAYTAHGLIILASHDSGILVSALYVFCHHFHDVADLLHVVYHALIGVFYLIHGIPDHQNTVADLGGVTGYAGYACAYLFDLIQGYMDQLQGLGNGIRHIVRSVFQMSQGCQNTAGGILGSHAQISDLICYNRKSLSCFSGSRRLYGGVQGKQIGLSVDPFNGANLAFHHIELFLEILQNPFQLVCQFCHGIGGSHYICQLLGAAFCMYHGLVGKLYHLFNQFRHIGALLADLVGHFHGGISLIP